MRDKVIDLVKTSREGTPAKVPVSLYLHYPFCVRKCRYCDFLSGPAGEEERNRYVGVLCDEIAMRAGELRETADGSAAGGGRGEEERACEVVTIFIGGGTPSLMTPQQLSRVMETVNMHYPLAQDAECSMEVNPGTADREKLRAFRSCGINRLSIGVQSLIDEELLLLGRIHTARQAREIFEAARAAGFSDLNVDLMSGLPGQRKEDWSFSLRGVTEWDPEHISAYSLQIEEGTPFYSMELPPLPSEEEDREMYHFTEEHLRERGFARYEISNYAREGYACRHNLGYWTGREYLGMGAGAASLLGGKRFSDPRGLPEYMNAVRSGDPVLLRTEEIILSVQDQMEEFMFLGLRLTEGVSMSGFAGRFGVSMTDVYGNILEKHLKEGVLMRDGERFRLTDYGLDVANVVMADYLF